MTAPQRPPVDDQELEVGVDDHFSPNSTQINPIILAILDLIDGVPHRVSPTEVQLTLPLFKGDETKSTGFARSVLTNLQKDQ